MNQTRKRHKEARRGISSTEQSRRKEETLRPSSYLGHDHYVLALHMIHCEAFEVAESELRRAIWLNPFEAEFTIRLAWCLYMQKRYIEARHCINEVPEEDLNDKTREMKRLIEEEDEKSKARKEHAHDNKHT